MAEIPPEMMKGNRQPDEEFHDDERLYRRVMPDSFDGPEPSLAAVELPDMSVIRGKYGRPEWLLLEEDYLTWGVIFFLVRDIPPNDEILHAGIVSFTLYAMHVPHAKNYPHSEVWVDCEKDHICREKKNLHLLNPDFHLRWRERIVLASHVAIHPKSQ